MFNCVHLQVWHRHSSCSPLHRDLNNLNKCVHGKNHRETLSVNGSIRLGITWRGQRKNQTKHNTDTERTMGHVCRSIRNPSTRTGTYTLKLNKKNHKHHRPKLVPIVEGPYKVTKVDKSIDVLKKTDRTVEKVSQSRFLFVHKYQTKKDVEEVLDKISIDDERYTEMPNQRRHEIYRLRRRLRRWIGWKWLRGSITKWKEEEGKTKEVQTHECSKTKKEVTNKEAPGNGFVIDKFGDNKTNTSPWHLYAKACKPI